MAFDAPVVLAVAPLVGGAVWFAAAWARRVRIRRAALWSEETVRRALRNIEEDYRVILILRDIDDLDYEAIAETLAISLPAVKSRLHRALGRLRGVMENDEVWEGRSG